MQKINSLIDQANIKLKRDSNSTQTEVGLSKPLLKGFEDTKSSDSDSIDLPPDRIDAINKVFAEFEFAYHNQFHKAFSSHESLTIAKKYWLSSLEEYSPSQIIAAAKKIIKSQEYLPSIATFLSACQDVYDIFGLPDPKAAYREACHAPSPKSAYQWSHEAVYFAGRETGWFLLLNEPESVSFPIFEYHYSLLSKKVVRGEKLNIENPPALTKKLEQPVSKDDLKSRISRLREELDF